MCLGDFVKKIEWVHLQKSLRLVSQWKRDTTEGEKKPFLAKDAVVVDDVAAAAAVVVDVVHAMCM